MNGLYRMNEKHSKISWRVFQEQWKLLYLQRGDQLNVMLVVNLMARHPNAFVHIVFFYPQNHINLIAPVHMSNTENVSVDQVLLVESYDVI